MNRVRSLAKPLCVLIAIQAGCLAFGLWLHNQFVIASAGWKATEHVWKQLAESAQEIRLNVLSSQAAGPAGTSDLAAKAAAAFDTIDPPAGTGLLVVDHDWNLLFLLIKIRLGQDFCIHST